MVSIDISEVRSEAIRLRPSVTVRIARSLFDMRKTTLELLAERPSEARLLLFVLLSDMVFVLSWSLKTLISPTATAAQSMGTGIALWLIVAIMLRTTAIYVMALIVGMVVKLFGGQASLKETRTGVFWGVFVAAPIGLLISEFAVLINAFEGRFPILGAESIQMMPYWLGLVPFVWFVSKGAAAANRIENAVPIFGVISAIAVALAVGVKYLAI